MWKIHMGSGRRKKMYLQLKAHHSTKFLHPKRSENRQFPSPQKKEKRERKRKGTVIILTVYTLKNSLPKISYSFLS